jgi:putative hydrolases of HD superfamily
MDSEIISFLESAGKLKKVSRKGWVTSAKVKNPESVADHTFRTAILIMCISDLKGWDTGALVRMALLHDVHEAIIGDYDYPDKEKIGKTAVEEMDRKAIKEVYSTMPKSLKEKYSSIATEYLEQKTPESRLVRQADRLEMLMQALEYEESGYNKDKLQTFWDSIGENLEYEEFNKILEQLRKKRTKKN